MNNHEKNIRKMKNKVQERNRNRFRRLRPYEAELQTLLALSRLHRRVAQQSSQLQSNSNQPPSIQTGQSAPHISQNNDPLDINKDIDPQEAQSSAGKRVSGEKLENNPPPQNVEVVARKFSKLLINDPSALSKLHLHRRILKRESQYSRKPGLGNGVRTEELPNAEENSNNNAEIFDSVNNNNAKLSKGSISKASSSRKSKSAHSSSSAGHTASDNSDEPIESGDKLFGDKKMRKLITNRGVVSMDNLYVTDSLGRAGCTRRGYMVRPRGAYTTRNASEIKLMQIKAFGSVDNEQLDKLVITLKLIGVLLMISSILLCLFIIGLSLFPVIVDYMREYLLRSRMTFIFILGGIIHPLIIGMYCLYSLSQLNHIRPYLLRIPFTLMFPIGLVITSIQFTDIVPHTTELYLQNQMDLYPDKQYVWDGLQNMLSCCGIHSNNDWKPHLAKPGESSYPKSCCISENDTGCPDFVFPSAFYSEGCLEKVKKLNVGLGGFIVFISILQFCLLLGSMIAMKKLYDMISDEMDDPRSNCKIIMGKCHSVCDSVEYDRQQELAENGQLHFQYLVKKLPFYSHTGNMEA